ncbi:MAG: hypothetical protein ACI8RZ_005759 [Myxococcota bacterium]|jgi:hypothetical protein
MTALILILSLIASAAPTLRAIDGTPVSLSGTTGSLAVLWSMDCAECVETMSALEDAGLPYVAINTDGAAAISQLRSFARVHDLTAPIIVDTDGMLRRSLQAQPAETLTIDSSGAVTLRMSSHDTEALLTQATMVAGQ